MTGKDLRRDVRDALDVDTSLGAGAIGLAVSEVRSERKLVERAPRSAPGVRAAEDRLTLA